MREGSGNYRISILITSRETIYLLHSCFRIEEANYDGSCRRIICVFYYRDPRYLMFYNNTFHWEDMHGNIWQTNRTFGDTKWFYGSKNLIVDRGRVTEGTNGNFETPFLTSGQGTQKQPFSGTLMKRYFENMQENTHAEV